MNTQRESKGLWRFIILIPHRDTGRLLDEYRRRLFAEGFPGAYSFPAAAALAGVSRSFSREELKELACNIRTLTKENNGKIRSAENALIPCPARDEFSGFRQAFFGPLLNISGGEELFSKAARAKVLCTLLPPVLCAALTVPGENTLPAAAPAGLREGFRAAALANLTIRPLGEGTPAYSHEWIIGSPVWLPVYKRN